MQKKIGSNGRLKLHRETLRSLTSGELANVGGATGDAAQCAGQALPANSNNYQFLCQNYGGGAANASSVLGGCPQLPTTISVTISVKFP